MSGQSPHFAFLPRNTHTASSTARERALALLDYSGNRFAFSAAFLICVTVTFTWYFLLNAAIYAFAGHRMPLADFPVYALCETVTLFASAVFSVPVYHGYAVLAAGTVRRGTADLRDIYLPFSGFGMFAASFLSGFLCCLSALGPFAGFALSLYFRNAWAALGTAAAAPLWIFLLAPLRRASAVHAASPEKGLGFAYRTAFSCPRPCRRERRKAAWAFVPALLLSLVTLMITGVYQTYGRAALTGAVLTADNEIGTTSRNNN